MTRNFMLTAALSAGLALIGGAPASAQQHVSVSSAGAGGGFFYGCTVGFNPGWYSQGAQGCGSSGTATTSGTNGPQTYAVTSNGSAGNPSAATAASVTDQANIVDGSYRGVASANLANGTVHILSFGSGSTSWGWQCGQGHCGQDSSAAAISDTLHFHVAGAGANTVTPITVSFRWDGTAGVVPDPQSGIAGYQIYGGFGAASTGPYNAYAPGFLYNFFSQAPDAWTDRYSASDGPAQWAALFNSAPAGWASFQWTSLSPTDVRFTGVYDIVGADATVPVALALWGDAYWGAQLDFSQTGSVSLGLPEGVTYTSDSGVFLTQGGVPEPATWAGVLLGIGGMGGLARRQRRRATI